MSRRHDWNRVGLAVEPELHEGFVNVREPLFHESLRLVGHIEIHASRTGALDLAVDRTRHDVTRRK